MDLDHVRDHLTACKAVIDSIGSLALAVTDIGAEIFRAMAACLSDSFFYFIYKDMEMSASRMAVTCRAFDDDLRHRKLFRLPARSDS